ncbi:hypothetical protein OROHE_020980 [Orobanche hederae]
MKSFSNEQSPNDCSGSLSRLNSHQMNLTNFYHNAPTRDIRLFMKSFSNEQSPNEPYEFLPQCFYR